jgi:isopenicillin-N epimerase
MKDKTAWSLKPGVTYLNHGSFGPSPRVVIEARNGWMAELESDPVDFLTRRLDGLLYDVRHRLGQFINCPGDDLLLIDNGTWAMNIVAGSVTLEPGDEVLLNDHEYGAVKRIWERRCAEVGARVVMPTLPLPMRSADDVVDCLFDAVTPRTRLLVFSHVTSPTAIILPAEAICRRAREIGLSVCVDGPHAPWHVPVDISKLDCDYYAASCHKWMCAPFGTGFLYVNPRVKAMVRPLIVSWGQRIPAATEASIHDEFTWIGTRDASGFLAIPTAIEFLEQCGVDVWREQTHALARHARQRIMDVTGLDALVPDTIDWYGSMISMPLPDGDAATLQERLWQKHRIEVPIMSWSGRRLVRPSCHGYTSIADVDRLVEALGIELSEERK